MVCSSIFLLNHLQADDVCVAAGDLLHDAFLAVLPVQSPGWTVAVELPRGVLVAQNVVAHDSEDSCRGGMVMGVGGITSQDSAEHAIGGMKVWLHAGGSH